MATGLRSPNIGEELGPGEAVEPALGVRARADFVALRVRVRISRVEARAADARNSESPLTILGGRMRGDSSPAFPEKNEPEMGRGVTASLLLPRARGVPPSLHSTAGYRIRECTLAYQARYHKARPRGHILTQSSQLLRPKHAVWPTISEKTACVCCCARLSVVEERAWDQYQMQKETQLRRSSNRRSTA